jgi:hypothetical protein
MKIMVGDDPDEHFAITQDVLQQLLSACNSFSQLAITEEGALNVKGITGRMLCAGA